MKDILKTNRYSFGRINLGNIKAFLMFTIDIVAYETYYHAKDMEMLLK